ncbi:MAG TPA: methionine--tRNA ligase [Acidimicrobiales bacterium]|jgi:methionyl-tRNA synthetase|nr:methionine--tRNA ligase [Acidimicrobiales bacterium]
MTRTYITVSIPYVNAAPHVGYALELVEADAVARHRRARGEDVRFLGGTDDHAIKNALAAEAAGVPVADYVDANARRFEALRRPLDISFDDFIRTSRDPRHVRGVEVLWRRSLATGDLYRGLYEGLYCVGCEQFYDAADLDDGRCPDHEIEVEPVREENWFFRLSAYTAPIRDALTSGRLRIVPESFAHEVLAQLDRGLVDISVSRSVERARGWGIRVPDDPSQVVYVWWEALTNYVTALDVAEPTSQAYHRWWHDADERIHVIGKGILRFHAIYWPALLLSTGQRLPTTIYVHPYLTAGGRKISKSLGNTVDPAEVIDRVGVDALRWWLLADVPRAADADYTDDRVSERAEVDLVNGVSNLAHRVLTIAHRPDRRLPAPRRHDLDLRDHVDAFDFRGAIGRINAFVRAANAEVERTKPWQLRTDDPAFDAVVGDLLGRLVALAEALEPFVPDTADRLRRLVTADAHGRLPVPEPLHRRRPR